MKKNLENKIWSDLKEGTERMLNEKEEEIGIKLAEAEKTKLVNIISGITYGQWINELKASLKDLLGRKQREIV